MGSVLITGGSGGIGSETARLLRERGNDVVLVARDPERLKAAAASIGARWFACDLSDPPAFGTVVDQIESDGTEITGLVHAVGSILLRPLHAVSLDDWNAVFERNVTTAFIAMKAVLPKMMRRRAGSIVLFSSVAASTGLPNHEAIAGAKAAIEGIVRSSAITYSRYGIRVNAVAPGLTKTELSKNLWATENALKVSEAMHPLGRIGSPRDIAGAAAFLAGEEAAWLTGRILAVDGGLSAGIAAQRST